MTWLRRRLRKGKLYEGTVVYCHDPFLVKIEGYYGVDKDGEIDVKALLRDIREGEKISFVYR